MLPTLFLALISIPVHAAPTKPGACGTGEHWVTAYHRRAYTRGDGTFVKATDVKSHCQKNPAHYFEWISKLKHKRPNWRPGTEKVAPWTTEERERLLEVLGETPDLLTKNKIDSIYRLHESSPPGNPASTNLNEIILYDNAFDPSFNLTHVLNHELSHRVFEDLPDSEKDSFLQAGHWKVDSGSGQFKSSRSPTEFIRKNGMLSPKEDFADDLTEFIHQPAKLRKISPLIFHWMEDHLGPKLRSGD
jgi:hypothetical protein